MQAGARTPRISPRWAAVEHVLLAGNQLPADIFHTYVTRLHFLFNKETTLAREWANLIQQAYNFDNTSTYGIDDAHDEPGSRLQNQHLAGAANEMDEAHLDRLQRLQDTLLPHTRQDLV